MEEIWIHQQSVLKFVGMDEELVKKLVTMVHQIIWLHSLFLDVILIVLEIQQDLIAQEEMTKILQSVMKFVGITLL